MQSLFHDKETGIFIEKTPVLKWSMKDGIYYETAANGTPGKAIVEWLSDDQITLTIVDGFEVVYDGLRKVYHRIK